MTLLVREGRAKILRQHRLKLRSATGDLHIEHPQLVLASEIDGHYDLVILSCKAYDLEDAISSFTPAVGPATVILPLLNGMRHLDLLDASFGKYRVFGGACMISTTLGRDGTIVHMGEMQNLVLGPRTDTPVAALWRVAGCLLKTGPVPTKLNH